MFIHVRLRNSWQISIRFREGQSKVEAQNYFDVNVQLLFELTDNQQKAEKERNDLSAQHAKLLEEKKQLRHSLDDPNAPHNALMVHLLAQTEHIADYLKYNFFL